MEASNTEISNYISQISLFISLISASLAFIVFKFNKNDAKKRAVYHMHQLWSSEYYRKCRVEAYNGVVEMAKQSSTISLSSISNTNLGVALGTVEHFFGDLYHLMDSGTLDGKLARKLFAPTIKAYFKDVFSHIEYDMEAEVDYFKDNIEKLAGLIERTK